MHQVKRGRARPGERVWNNAVFYRPSPAEWPQINRAGLGFGMAKFIKLLNRV